jgi:hypothetical protein
VKVGLDQLPGVSDLEEGYNQILRAQQELGGKIDLYSFSKLCQWSRFDSRMAEICVNFFSIYWKQLNPVELHDAFEKQPWPNVLGVLLEFCLVDSPLFRSWKKTATCGFSKANWEQFYIGKRRIGGQLMMDDVRFSLEEYRRWGYLSREVLLQKQRETKQVQKKYSYSPATRLEILKDLIRNHPRITTQQYWDAIARSVSKRQAERDLEASSIVIGRGTTKGRYFVKR